MDDRGLFTALYRCLLMTSGVIFWLGFFYALYIYGNGLNSIEKFKRGDYVYCSNDFTMNVDNKSFVLDRTERYYLNYADNIVFGVFDCK